MAAGDYRKQSDKGENLKADDEDVNPVSAGRRTHREMRKVERERERERAIATGFSRYS